MNNKLRSVVLPVIATLLVNFGATVFNTASSEVTVTTEVLHEPRFFRNSKRSSFFDQDGHLHVFYGGNHLYHGKLVNGVWNIETIDSLPVVGYLATAAMDKSGAFHVMYWDEYNDEIRYATNQSGNWESEKVDVAHSVTGLFGAGIFSVSTEYKFGSIAADDSGRAHIVVGCQITNICHAVRTAEGWINEVVDTNALVNGNNSLSIAIKKDSTIVVVYKHNKAYLDDGTTPNYSHEGVTLKLARKVAGIWSYKVIDDWESQVGSSAYMYNAVAVDESDNIHIAYIGYNLSLQYATDSSGGWVTEQVGVDREVKGHYVSLAIRSDGLPVMADYSCCNLDDKSVHYIEKQSSGWSIEKIVSGDESSSGYISLALSPADIPHVQFFKTSTVELFDTSPVMGIWERTLIEQSDEDEFAANGQPDPGWTGKSPDLIVDKEGVLRATYQRGDFLSNWVVLGSNKSGVWQSSEITPSPFYLDSQISLDGGGYNHLMISSTGGLYYATDKTGNWIQEFVDNVNTVYRGESEIPVRFGFRADSDGAAHMAYFTSKVAEDGQINDIVVYATNKSGGWVYEEVFDAGWYFGNHSDEFVSLSVGADGAVHIGFLDRARNLMYATNKSGDWVTGKVVGEDPVNHWGDRDLYITADGIFHMAYERLYCASYTCFQDGVGYATNKSGAWMPEIIDDEIFYTEETNSGMDRPFISIDRYGHPHVGYRYFERDFGGSIDFYISQPRYAYKTESGWNSLVVDYAPITGLYNSVATHGDAVYYGYHDDPNKSLKLATITGTVLEQVYEPPANNQATGINAIGAFTGKLKVKKCGKTSTSETITLNMAEDGTWNGNTLMGDLGGTYVPIKNGKVYSLKLDNQSYGNLEMYLQGIATMLCGVNMEVLSTDIGTFTAKVKADKNLMKLKMKLGIVLSDGLNERKLKYSFKTSADIIN